MNKNNRAARKERWVIKIGSALLTSNGNALAHDSLDKWVPQIAALCQRGFEVVLVSSGAVAEGMQRLGWTQRPQSLHDLQAAAAVGQAGLVQSYQARFGQFGIQVAQILLVHDDLSSRSRYLNARQTMNSLLALGAIPVVNENDTVATEEIRFGDNDTLAGLVANLVDADRLLILTDQDGVYDSDPRNNPAAELIKSCNVDDARLDRAAGSSGGALGRGGMLTKLRAARLAARSATTTVIANGNEANIIERIAAGEPCGTALTNQRKPLAARKQWLAGGLQVRGVLRLDEGAAHALRNTGVSLLPIGVTAVEGKFERGDLVSCVDPAGSEIARGLCNYAANEAEKILRKSSAELAGILGYTGDQELIHRNNLAVL
ncbi:MAG: glutamate 5-kinase [Pseudomonadales bacterium]